MTRPDVTVAAEADTGRARLFASAAASAAGLSTAQRAKVQLAVTELATNLLRHAGQGVLSILAPVPGQLDVLALDRGPGIARLDRSMRDGFSTAGSMGGGLGAVRRACDAFDAYSLPDTGTAILARWYATPPRPTPFRIGVAAAAAPGEDDCGDLWGAWTDGPRLTVALSDGLGHGSAAYLASREIIAALGAHRSLPPNRLLDTIHPMVASTRGGTVAVAHLSAADELLEFGGVGNIAARLVPSAEEPALALVCRPGIVGARTGQGTAGSAGSFHQASYLVMHSDGVSERWSFAEWEGLLTRDPAVIAGWLLAQRGRGRDDACVVVVTGSSA